jgi:hypothetical protein
MDSSGLAAAMEQPEPMAVDSSSDLTSSSAESQADDAAKSADGDVEKGVSPNFLARNWPPAFKEWNTKAVRDAFYASPVFPRILNAESIKDTIAKGVEAGLLAYVGKGSQGSYQPFSFKQSISPFDVVFSEDMFIFPADAALAYAETQAGGETGNQKWRTAPPEPVPFPGTGRTRRG